MKGFLFVISILLSNTLCSQVSIDSVQMYNSIVFADVYGHVKYYYPIKNTSALLWEDIVSVGLATVSECKNDDELKDSLESFFSKIAPEIVFTNSNIIINDTINLKKKKYYYEHEGFGQGKISSSSKLLDFLITLTQPYKTKIKYRKPKTNIKFYRIEYENITTNIPYGVDKPFKIKNFNKQLEVEEIHHNIGAVIIAWNIYKHFYPYQRNIMEDWGVILKKAITIVSLENTEYGTFKALNYLSYTLNDGHARTFYRDDSLHYLPPFKVRIIDSSLVVSEVLLDFKDEISLGVEILMINKVPIKKLIDSLKYQVSSSTQQWRDFRIEDEILKGTKNSNIKITYRENYIVKEKTIIRNKTNSNWVYQGEGIKLIGDSIYYLDINELTYSDFKKNISKFNSSKGIIVDFRGYPKTVNILKHFKDTVLKSSYWKVPYKTLYTINKDEYVSKGPATRWTIKPSNKLITVPTVFISDGSAISFAETCLDMIKYYNLGTIIGQSTAGSNGNVNGFWIYNKYYCIFTGMKVVKNDGELITKDGITPDIVVPVTKEGIKMSKDERLFYAIDYLKQLNK